MALSFFRKRQKMVVIIMAVLMVSFLIGFKGLEMLFRTKREVQIIGRVADEIEITQPELSFAASTMTQLDSGAWIGLGNPRRWPMGDISMAEMDMEFIVLRDINLRDINGSDRNKALAWKLLSIEADQAGIEVSQSEVDAFFSAIGLTGEQYSNRIAELRESKGLTESRFRGLAAAWLRVHKSFVQSRPATPPSRVELRRLYRDLNEKIQVRVLRISARDFVDNAAKFTDPQIAEHFGRYKAAPADQYPTTDSFGFGYLQPHRLAIKYIVIDRETIARVMSPDESQIVSYYESNRSQFTKQVEIPKPAPTTATAPSSTTKEATDEPKEDVEEPVEYETVQMTPAEAEPQIREVLIAELSRSNTEKTASNVEGMLVGIREDKNRQTDKDPYDQVRSGMVLPAEKILARTLKNIKIVAMPLDEAMDILAGAARIKGICYPWGKHGAYDLSKDIKVTYEPGQPVTLGDALGAITRQVFSAAPEDDKGEDDAAESDTQPSTTQPARLVPKLEWAMCLGFDAVLFPVGGDVEMFPVSVGGTALLTRQELSEHTVLGSCATDLRGGQNLLTIAMQTAELLPESQRSSAPVRVGAQGARMVLLTEGGGQVIWRPIKALAAHVPEKITPVLREQILKDMRLAAAFKIAESQARTIKTKADVDGLEAAAVSAKMKLTEESDLFTRKTKQLAGRTTAFARCMMYIQRLQSGQEMAEQEKSMLVYYLNMFRLQYQFPRDLDFPPYYYSWSRVNIVDLPQTRHGKHSEYFMEKAFSLTPSDIEKGSDAEKSPVAIFSLPARGEVLILERSGYEPAMISDFEKGTQEQLAYESEKASQWRSMIRWFYLPNIIARMEFVPEKK